MFTVRGLPRQQPRIMFSDTCFHAPASRRPAVNVVCMCGGKKGAKKKNRPSYSVKKNTIFSLVFVFFFSCCDPCSQTRAFHFLFPGFFVSFWPSSSHENRNRENGQIESRRSSSCSNLVDVLGGLLRDAPLGRDRHLLRVFNCHLKIHFCHGGILYCMLRLEF